VDIHGNPHDPDDASQWPESNEVDGWFWTATPDGDDAPPADQISDVELSMVAAGLALG
jgi:hypothetical protein